MSSSFFIRAEVKKNMLNASNILTSFGIPSYNDAARFPFKNLTVKIGILIPEDNEETNSSVGYHRTASAITVGYKNLLDGGFIDQTKLSFDFLFHQVNCTGSLATKYAIELLIVHKVDVIIFPPCDSLSNFISFIYSSYNRPVYLWGSTVNSLISTSDDIQTVVSVSPSIDDYTYATTEFLNYFKWQYIAFVYMDHHIHNKCSQFQSHFVANVLTYTNIIVQYVSELNTSVSSMKTVLRELKQHARIIVACVPTSKYKRQFMLAAFDENMTNDEYLYIFVEINNFVFNNNIIGEIVIWEGEDIPNDGRDGDAITAFGYAFMIFKENKNQKTDINTFTNQIKKYMTEWPVNCNDTLCLSNLNNSNFQSSSYASYLADTMILYGLALNKTLSTEPLRYNDGQLIKKNSLHEFDGYSGTLTFGSDGVRLGMFEVIAFNNSYSLVTLFKIYEKIEKEYTVNPLFETEEKIWLNRLNNKRPTDKPKCGFTNNNCKNPFTQQYGTYIIIIIAVLIILIIGGILLIIYIKKTKKKQQMLLDELWLIKYTHLKVVNLAKIPSGRTITSNKIIERSLENFNLNRENSGNNEKKLNDENIIEDDNVNTIGYFYKGEIVVGKKFHKHLSINNKIRSHLRMLREIDHENLNKFIGLTGYKHYIIPIWKYCSRGSLKDWVLNDNNDLEPFYVVSLMDDIASGIAFLHASKICYHGRLTSSTCLLDNHYQVKITNIGLNLLAENFQRTENEQLYTAPELLRTSSYSGTKEGDIYSFAIISSELFNKAPAWFDKNENMLTHEIITKIKKSRLGNFRPIIHDKYEEKWVKDIIKLVTECWSEDPMSRKKIGAIKTIIKKAVQVKNINLMDYMFQKTENYAAELEEDVRNRTRELYEEKMKCDKLLYRMMPKSVVEKLKSGEEVQPEYFESATVFFSDVVSFTDLCAQCTPLQVVSFLNQLYSRFDELIERFDAYKVETIGDAYLVVSGIPIRNGNRHGEMIANMALGFMESLPSFKLSFLPDYRLNLRIGLHTGSVVAGVVGLQMPRYCLFGDTVNTASRMESNGMPGCIHISQYTEELLSSTGGFKITQRGSVLIKGKGKMVTYWLLGRENEPEKWLEEPQ
uniref:Guanylate cyclase n=1 Tax=Strongyloides venezuelensis TaxID=75913 RepID=A0A0K0FVD3_STRVS